MSLINEIYAGTVTDEPRLVTCEISNPNFTEGTVRICTGFFPRTVTLETGETVVFTGAGIDVKLPKRDTSGQQNLTIAIDNVNGDISRLIDESQGEYASVTIREYILSDLSEPAAPPISLLVAGAAMEGSGAQITASYQNPIVKAWPRRRYTIARFPGLSHSA